MSDLDFVAKPRCIAQYGVGSAPRQVEQRRTLAAAEFLNTLLVIGILLLSGCGSPPMHVNTMREPELRAIVRQMDHTIRELRSESDQVWHSGLSGNAMINTFGGPNTGLCYHWQEVIYFAVQPVAEREGWEAVGVGLNLDNTGEHHAVLVYDPELYEPPAPLLPDHRAYVLDAWRRGEADVFTLADWLVLPRLHRGAAVVEDVDALAGTREAK